MKQPIRFFATGLLTATLLLFIIYLMVEKPQTDNQLTIDDMIKEVEDEGFHVLTKSEYITYSVEKNQNVAKQNEDENSDSDPEDHINGENKEKEAKEKNEEEKEKKETDKKEDKSSEKEKEDSKEYKYTLTIEENMLGPTISDLLVEHNIIDDAKIGRAHV